MTVHPATSDSIAIRSAKRADLLDVYRLERTCFPSPWPYQAFLSHLDAPAFLLAIADGALAGYVVADVHRTFSARVGHVKDLAVAPEHRRVGIGTGLMEAAIERLRADGADRVTLEVRRENEGARALYRSLGFRGDRVESGYYEDGMDAVIMVRRL